MQTIPRATEGGVGKILGREATSPGVDGTAPDVRRWWRDGASVGHVGGGRPHTGQHVSRATSNLLQGSSGATNADPLLELSPYYTI